MLFAATKNLFNHKEIVMRLCPDNPTALAVWNVKIKIIG
jgi:hypothetical protein